MFVYRKLKFLICLGLELTELTNGTENNGKSLEFFSHEIQSPTPLRSLLSSAQGSGEKLVQLYLRSLVVWKEGQSKFCAKIFSLLRLENFSSLGTEPNPSAFACGHGMVRK